ncbi:hypothetical protein H2203_003624 [Taxawa tesnikishii (nom. ined.)]|nr:hypothetical protein H2203_003624 [Dothideales sp. JES 119]
MANNPFLEYQRAHRSKQIRVDRFQAHKTQGMSFLLALAPEVVQQIVQFLDPAGLSALRLTCKELSEKAFHEFNQRVKENRYVASRESLSALLGVSKHKQLSESIRHLKFGTQSPVKGGLQPQVHSPDLYLSYVRDQIQFAKGDDAAMLALAFNNLSNLTSVQIGQWPEPHEETEASWGMRTFKARTGGDLQWMQNDFDILTRTFSAVLSALMSTQKPSLTTLKAHFCGHSVSPHLNRIDHYRSSVNVGNLDLTGFVVGSLRPCLANLENLELSLEYRGILDDIESEDAQRACQWLPSFIDLVPQLRSLVLHFEVWSPIQYSLNEKAVFEHLARRSRLEHLASLSLNSIQINRFDFLSFVSEHPKLEQLTLRFIQFCPQSRRGEPNWLDVLATLNERLPRLKKVEFAWLAMLDSFNNDYVLGKDTMLCFDQWGLENCLVCQRASPFEYTMFTCEHSGFSAESKDWHSMIAHSSAAMLYISENFSTEHPDIQRRKSSMSSQVLRS